MVKRKSIDSVSPDEEVGLHTRLGPLDILPDIVLRPTKCNLRIKRLTTAAINAQRIPESPSKQNAAIYTLVLPCKVLRLIYLAGNIRGTSKRLLQEIGGSDSTGQ